MSLPRALDANKRPASEPRAGVLIRARVRDGEIAGVGLACGKPSAGVVESQLAGVEQGFAAADQTALGAGAGKATGVLLGETSSLYWE